MDGVDAAENAAAVVGRSDCPAVFGAECIVVLTASQLGDSEALAELHSLDSGNAEQCVRENSLESVEPRLTNSRREAADSRFEYASDAVSLGFSREYSLGHFVLARVIENCKRQTCELIYIITNIAEKSVSYTAARENVRADFYSFCVQRGNGDSSRRNDTCGDSSREVTAAANVIEAPVAESTRIIGVSGAHEGIEFGFGVIGGVLIGVLNKGAEGRSRGLAV